MDVIFSLPSNSGLLVMKAVEETKTHSSTEEQSGCLVETKDGGTMQAPMIQ